MKKSFCCLLVLLSFSIFIQSCEEESTNPPDKDDVLIPLKVGNYWKALFTDYDFGGEPDTVGIYVVRDSVWNGEKIYKISSTPNSSGEVPIFWLNRSNGFYVLDILNGYTELRLELKYPAIPGDYFMFEGDTTFVELINADYTVPAGTFKCYKYVSEYVGDDMIYKTIHYNCPGIGPVATENYYQDENREMYLESKWELIEYKVK